MQRLTINNESIMALMRSRFSERALSYYEKLLDYTKTVAAEPKRIESARFRLEGDEYRNFIENIDTSRKIQHDASISSLNIMNRMCEKEGIDPVTDPVDLDELDRGVIAAGIFKHVKDVLDQDKHAVTYGDKSQVFDLPSLDHLVEDAHQSAGIEIEQ